jgi:hypothetical protein
MIGAFPGCQRSSASQRLTERQCHIVGLTSADKEADRANPILVLESDLNEIIGSTLPLEPAHTLVEDWGIGSTPDSLDNLGVSVPQGSRCVARVDNASTVLELKPHPTRPDYMGCHVLADRQTGRQKARSLAAR